MFEFVVIYLDWELGGDTTSQKELEQSEIIEDKLEDDCDGK